MGKINADIHLHRYYGDDKEYSIMEGITYIEENAFSNCENLEVVYIPKTVTGINSSAFSSCKSLKKIIVDEENTNYFSFENILYETEFYNIVWIPEGIEGTIRLHEKVRNFDVNFAYCTKLKKVICPQNLSSLPYHFFKNCTSLEEVVLPDNIDTIKEKTFSNCKSLKKINIPSSLKYIESSAFENCENLQTLTGNLKNVKEIFWRAFENCKSLNKIELGKDLNKIDDFAFYNCTSLNDVVLDSENESFYLENNIMYKKEEGKLIPYFTFNGIDSNLVIPSYFNDTIPSNFFEDCIQLKSVVIPEGITTISENTFYNCSKLEKIELPSSLTSIKNKAFKNCSQLKSITIPEGITTISENTFCGCSKLEKIELPSSLTSIEKYAFADCSQLKNIAIPEGITTISENTFYNCSKLEKIELPSSLTSIKEEAFKNCSSLVEFSLPENVLTIEEGAFLGCTSLLNVNICNKNLQLKKYWAGVKGNTAEFDGNIIKAFLKNMSTSQVAINIKVTLLHYIAQLIVEDGFDSSLKKNWLKYLKGRINVSYDQIIEDPDFLTAVTKEKLLDIDDIKTLVSMASEKENVDVSSKLLDYENKNFSSDQIIESTMNELTVDKGSVDYIKNNWVKEKTNLEKDEEVYTLTSYKGTDKDIYIPCNCENILFDTIGEHALSPCKKYLLKTMGTKRKAIKTVTIADGISTIQQGAFEQCTSLEEINLPNSIKKIEDSVFLKCESLKSITIPSNISKIGNSFCSGCSKLEQIQFNDKLKTISKASFKNCTSLKTITIPERVTSIGDSAFEGCTNLQSINLPEGLKTIEKYAFRNCSNITSLDIPDSVTTINAGAFFGMESLNSIKLPKNLKSIKGIFVKSKFVGVEEIACKNFFYGCNLSKVIVPSNVKTIGTYAFKGSTIKRIELEEGVECIAEDAFGCDDNYELIIPKSVKEIDNSAFGGYGYWSSIDFYVYKDSYAQSWLDSHGYSYTLLD